MKKDVGATCGRPQNGITLIALIITIIIMLILAGVTISIAVNGGLFKQAKNAADLTNQAAQNEQETINNVLDEMSNNANGGGSTNNANDGGSTNNSGGAPIPAGFYYVGGTENTGVVISDNAADENKGDTCTTLQGNQFVWVPCTLAQLKEISWAGETFDAANYHETLPTGLTNSINQYKGFYIGRYEISYGSGTSVSDYVALSRKSTSATSNAWVNTSGRLWNYITWSNAAAACGNMYNKNTDSVVSHLIYGSEWDRTLQWLIDTNTANPTNGKSLADVQNSSYWGNYFYTKFTYSEGINYGGTWNGTKYSANVVINTGDSVANFKANNIYDLAGNLWEWTQEKYSTNSQAIRGGTYDQYLWTGVYCRYDGNLGGGGDMPTWDPTKAYADVGARVVLYIK